MKFTVLGASGFIGSRLVRHLEASAHEVIAATREATEVMSGRAGHVICCIGLTSDFRTHPYETVDAHVCIPARLMRSMEFDSWLTLSSTRVYRGLEPSELASEELALPIRPGLDALYDSSKLLSEALTLSHRSPTARVVRLSNVCGTGQDHATFLASILADVARDNRVVVHEHPDSAKDYVDLDDVLPLIEAIATRGRQRLYNVASGCNTSHAALAELLRRRLGASVEFATDGPSRTIPRIDISRATSEFDLTPTTFDVTLDRMLAGLRHSL